MPIRPKREQTADHARENKQQRQVGALADQDRPQKIIHGTRDHRPDEQKCSPSRVAGPEEPSHRSAEHRDNADLGNRQKQHRGGKHAGERHSGDHQTESAEDRLRQGRHDDAEGNAANRLAGEIDRVLAARIPPDGGRSAPGARLASSPLAYMAAARITVNKNSTNNTPTPPNCATNQPTKPPA